MIKTEKKYKVCFDLYTGQEVIAHVSDDKQDAEFHRDLMIDTHGYKNTHIIEIEERYIYCEVNEGFRVYINNKIPVLYQGKELYQVDSNIWYDSYDIEKNKAHVSFVDTNGNLYCFNLAFMQQ